LDWVLIPVAIVFLLHNFVFQAYHVVGTSMVPTLHESDYLIVSKVSASISRLQHKDYIPQHGDIVVFHFPKNTALVFVKRIIAVPGDRVVIKDGTVTVYDKAHPSGYNPDTTHALSTQVTLSNPAVDEVVPDGNVFVLGDNREPGASYDSRDWGDLPSKDIIGQAVIRLLPLDTFKIFSDLPQTLRL
jgi:signal peptidase I